MRRAANLVNADVAALSGGRVGAVSEGGAAPDPAMITDDLRTRANAAPISLPVGDERYLSRVLTYRDGSGGVLGDIYISIDEGEIRDAALGTQTTILRTMAIAAVVATAAAWIFGWVALCPLRPLLAAAGRL